MKVAEADFPNGSGQRTITIEPGDHVEIHVRPGQGAGYQPIDSKFIAPGQEFDMRISPGVLGVSIQTHVGIGNKTYKSTSSKPIKIYVTGNANVDDVVAEMTRLQDHRKVSSGPLPARGGLPFARIIGPPHSVPKPQPSRQTQSTPKGPAKVSKSCTSCPAWLPAAFTSKQREVLGAALGIDVCGRLAMPLSTSSLSLDQRDEALEIAANGCAYHNMEWDGTPAINSEGQNRFASTTIEYPSNEVDLFGSGVPPQARAASCNDCTYFLESKLMHSAAGIPLAGCRAKGKLIRLGSANTTAAECAENTKGVPSRFSDLKDLTMLSHLRMVELVDPSDDSTFHEPQKEEKPIVDPTLVETDREVTAEEAAQGIRAWVKLRDRVFMPVFRRDFFSEDEQKKIPQSGDDEHPELYQDHLGLLPKAMVIWTKLQETPALNGPAGTGKTEFGRYAAWRMQIPFERVSITASMELDELAGKMLFEDKETRFHYGRIPTSWAKPNVLVIDEPNTGSNAVWQFLRPLTDNSKQLVLDLNKGERISRNPHCYMFMAFNPAHDHRNSGTNEIADADARRLMHIAIPAPDHDMEKKIIRQRCEADGYAITDATMEKILGIAKDLRQLANEDDIPIQWGTAQSIKVARLSEWFDMQDSVRLAIADLLEPQYCEKIMTTVNSNAGSKPSGGAPRNPTGSKLRAGR